MGVVVALAVSGLLATMAPPASGEAVAGGAGTDTSLPPTDSQVTVNGRGRFADLQVTVNQTRSLGNQAISVTWTGGAPTVSGHRFDANYLQMMECWGDDDGTNPDNPGPPPEQCVFGATDAVSGGRSSSIFPVESGSLVLERIVSRRNWPGFDASDGFLETSTGLVYKPFRAVNGTVVDVAYDANFNSNVGGDYWINPYFNSITTNEIAGGRTKQNGTGAELFEVNTGVESSGLGCGQSVEHVDGATRIPKCWLVIVPRGTPADENVDSVPAETLAVLPSPLAARPWKNRIAVPLEFNPVDSPCSLADDARRLAGTELVAPAVASWQPKLCSSPGLPPYSYGVVSDPGARQQLLGGAAGAPGMIVVSRPFDASAGNESKPIVYAPLSLSALVIGFNIERVPKSSPPPPKEVEELRGVRVAQLDLTPRLVAKLLTQSYRQQLEIKAFPPPYEWVRANPRHLGDDPDFIQFNPEFSLLENGGKNFGGLVMSSRNSDAAAQVWEWVLSDPEARAWLDGAPDPWGMNVNPAYATTAEANATGVAFGDPVPSSFPKSDPYCFQGKPEQGLHGLITPPQLCGTDWLPYAGSLREAARSTRAADDAARTLDNFTSADRPDQVYKRDTPQVLGSRTILSLTDSASAYQYGVQVARLSRSGDNGPDRAFVAPDEAGLTAGVAAMAPKGEPTVLEPVPTASAPAAYPLTTLTYAALTPLSLDAKARQEYAAFVDYAAGAGQVPGLELGQLPPGFAPLPEALRAEATAAATQIRELVPPPKPEAKQPTPGPTAPTSSTTVASSAARVTSASPSSSPSPSSSSGSSDVGGGASSPASRPPVAPVTVAPAAPGPAPVTNLLTPVVAVAGSRFVLPVLVGVLLLSGLGALEIAKRPLRGSHLSRRRPVPRPNGRSKR